MNEIAITPEAEKQAVVAEKYLARATEYNVNSNEIAIAATDAQVAITKKYNEIETMRKHLKEPALEQGRRIDAFFKGPLDNLKSAKTLLKTKLIAWQNKQEAKRLAIEAEAQERARKEREKLEARAAKATDKGKEEKAEALQVQADAVLTPIIAPLAPKPKGLVIQTRWYAEVTSAEEVIQGVCDGKIPKMAIDINMPFFNKQATALKGEMNYPGVVAKSKQV